MYLKYDWMNFLVTISLQIKNQLLFCFEIAIVFVRHTNKKKQPTKKKKTNERIYNKYSQAFEIHITKQPTHAMFP